MTDFLLKLWQFARPYRIPPVSGRLTGILAGLMAPLMIITITFVSSVMFPAPDQKPIEEQWLSLPQFVVPWLHNTRAGLESGLHQHRGALILFVGTIPLVMLLRGVVAYLNTYFLQWTAIRTVTDLRIKLFAHLLDLSAGFFTQSRSGELISRIMNDTGALQGIFSGATSVIVRDPVTLVSILAALLWRPETRSMTLISLMVLPVCMIPLSIYSRKVRRASREMQSQSADLMQVMTEAFTGHRVVKAYNLEIRRHRRVPRRPRANPSATTCASSAPTNSPRPIIDFLGSTGVALALLYMNSPPGRIPTRAISSSSPEHFFHVSADEKPHAAAQPAHPGARRQRTRLRNCSPRKIPCRNPPRPKCSTPPAPTSNSKRPFHLRRKSRCCDDINLTVKPGQLVALVGASGSGKTTLANLLLRFYDPTRGAIRIGGVDIREVTTRDLRNQIAVVAQETILFNDTIRRNIELGRLGATNDEIIAAASHAYAYEFIMQKPKASTPSSAKRACRFPAASASGSPSPAPF